jgi:hypothetical protein
VEVLEKVCNEVGFPAKNPDLGPISELIHNAIHGWMLPVFNLDPG